MALQKKSGLGPDETDLFEKLPNELLSQIVSYLPRGYNQTNVALTCRRLHRIVEPLFFESVSLIVNKYTSKSGGGVPKYSRLLRILEKRVEVRGWIKRLSLALFLTGLLPDSQFYVTKLLKLLPFIEELRLSAPPNAFDMDAISLDHADIVSCGQQTWETYGEAQASLDPELILYSLLYMKKLRTLVLHGDSSQHLKIFDTKSVLFWSPPSFSLQAFSNVSDIRIYAWDRWLEAGSLKAVLLKLHILRCFHLEITSPWESALHQSTFRVPIWGADLEEALQRHSATLEELLICASDAAGFKSEQVPSGTEQGLFRLANFPRLKRLGIPEDFVEKDAESSKCMFASWLPPNIEVLQMQYQMYASQAPDRQAVPRQSAMEDLLHSAPSKFPKLKRVIWWIQQYECLAKWTYGYGKILDELEREYENPQFEWLSEPFMDETPFFNMRRGDADDVE